MSRVRTVQTARQVGNVTVIKTATVGGMRQLRCPKCQGMATPTRSHTGQNIYRCMVCGAQFLSRKL
jgi:DNA-directed RNA polymerase subunit RPC12/RpoP